MIFLVRMLGFWLLRTAGPGFYRDLRARDARGARRRAWRLARAAIIMGGAVVLLLLILSTALVIWVVQQLD